jgi:hypothetical protein
VNWDQKSTAERFNKFVVWPGKEYLKLHTERPIAAKIISLIKQKKVLCTGIIGKNVLQTFQKPQGPHPSQGQWLNLFERLSLEKRMLPWFLLTLG